MTKYRDRIYQHYLAAGGVACTPSSASGFSPRQSTLRHLVKRHFPADRAARILDLGCGSGAIAYFAGQAGYTNIRGVDVSAAQVEAAARLGIPGVEQGDLFPYLQKTSPSSIDVVVTFDVIEHFTKDELVGIVDEIHRVLRIGGRWIIHAPNADSPFGGAIRYGDFSHEQAFTRASLEQLLRASGFSQVEAFESRPIAHGVRSSVRATLWRICRINMRLFNAIETGSLGATSILSRNLIVVGYR